MIQILRLWIVYLTFSAACAWLANRLVSRFSRRVFLGLLLLPLALTGHAMLTGGFFGPLNMVYEDTPLREQAPPQMQRNYDDEILSDIARQMIPWRKAVRESIKHGRFPLWNRFMFAGDVLAGAAVPAPFHPINLLECLLPLATAWTFGCTATFFLVGLCTFLYLRELGISEPPAFFGAAVWTFSGFMVFWVGWPQALTFAPLPLLCLGLRRLARREARGTGITAVGCVLILIAGHPESILHVATAAGIIFLVELVSHRELAFGAVTRSCLAGAIAVGISAPVLFPFLEAMPQTVQYLTRRQFYAHEKKSTSVATASSAALYAVYPDRSQSRWGFGGAPGKPQHSEDAVHASVGGLALALAVLGLLSCRRERWVFALMGLFCLTIAVALPGTTELLNRLPWFDIALNWRLSGITALCLAVLSAMGLDRLLLRTSRLDPFYFAGAAGVFAAGWLALQTGPPGAGDLPTAAGLRWLLLATLVFAAITWVFRRRPSLVAASAVGVFLVTHLAEIPRLYPTFDRSLFYPRIAEFDRLPRNGDPYRVAGLDYTLIPNHATLYELEDARGNSATVNLRWMQTQSIWSNQIGYWFNMVVDPGRPFASFLNIRYFIAEPSRALPAGLKELLRGPSCAIFENPRALPRAFAPETIRFAGPDEPAAEEMRGCEDFAKLAWIDAARSEGPVANGRASVSAREDGPDLLLHIQARSPAWIVASETAWKGWHAREGRRELPIRIANHAFLAFQVPAGSHDVRLIYWPRSFTLGLIACLLTAAGCLTALLLRPRGNSTAPAALTGR